MDKIYDILIKEHSEVSELIKKATQDDTKNTFNQIKAKLQPHLLGEEELFYPALEENEELIELVNHAYDEHEEIKTILQELDNSSEGDRSWIATVHALDKVVSHHVEEEENKVFPAAQKVISDNQAQEIAKQYAEFSKNFKPQPIMG
ncbi:Regulator of cell morphogenesis and NO signaling [Methanosarcina barkeri 3]|uniref:Regulator of cell morphogenesis and NO signaling n=1 Tax=Methanosarcina barkeri 3 TaxID=1434107 RepID=A0A0E3SM21_METBA|nr:hemerythrin domain-containing protein [Methanosarcina barkeri]AKB82417.1 Regulator of cell morphogenesis and NO signaling [Methanosarcina barkeri 3]